MQVLQMAFHSLTTFSSFFYFLQTHPVQCRLRLQEVGVKNSLYNTAKTQPKFSKFYSYCTNAVTTNLLFLGSFQHLGTVSAWEMTCPCQTMHIKTRTGRGFVFPSHVLISLHKTGIKWLFKNLWVDSIAHGRLTCAIKTSSLVESCSPCSFVI